VRGEGGGRGGKVRGEGKTLGGARWAKKGGEGRLGGMWEGLSGRHVEWGGEGMSGEGEVGRVERNGRRKAGGVGVGGSRRGGCG